MWLCFNADYGSVLVKTDYLTLTYEMNDGRPALSWLSTNFFFHYPNDVLMIQHYLSQSIQGHLFDISLVLTTDPSQGLLHVAKLPPGSGLGTKNHRQFVHVFAVGIKPPSWLFDNKQKGIHATDIYNRDHLQQYNYMLD